MAKKTDKEKYSFFLFSIGEAGREIFNTWIWPKIVDDKGDPTDEDDIVVAALFKKFDDYCKPKRNLIVERHKFNTRRQNPGEAVDHYITELKTLAASCEYGNLTNDLITSQLVAGIQSDKIRDRLLREGSGLTLEKTIDICRSHEVTQEQMKLFHGECEVDSVNKRHSGQNNRARHSSMTSDRNSRSKQVQEGRTERSNVVACRNCGRNHEARRCPAYGKECYRCQKKNHFGKMCRSDSKQSQRPNKEVKAIRADSSDDFVIDIVESQTVKETEATAVINILDGNVRVKLDTGAEVNVMPNRVYQKLVTEKKNPERC